MKHWTRKLTTLLLALATMCVLFSIAFAASYKCPMCSTSIDPSGWVPDPSFTDYHFQYCYYCSRTVYEAHTSDNRGVCTVCGYQSSYVDSYDRCTECSSVLSNSAWYASPEFSDYHFQLCAVCNRINYREHTFDAGQKCIYCSASGSGTNYINNISVTIAQGAGVYYFTDANTQSGYSVYQLIESALPYQSGTRPSDYYVSFNSYYSSSVATLPGNGYYASGALTDLSNIYLSIHSYGTWSAEYTVTLGVTEVLSGTLSITIEPSVDLDMHYTAILGEQVPLNVEDFYNFWSEYTNGFGDLTYVSISSVNGLNGTLCFGHTANETRHTSAVGSTFYTRPTGSQKALSSLTFVPGKNGNNYPTGSVTISFTAYGTNRYENAAFARGNIIISYTSGEVDPIIYSSVSGSVTLDPSDFDSVYMDATASTTRNPSYTIRFLDVPANGTLYRNFNSNNYGNLYNSELTKSNISTLTFSNRSNSANSIGTVTYVPAYNNSDGDTVRYAAYSGSTLLYVGTIEFNAQELIISYGCTSEGVTFSAADFYGIHSSMLYAQYITFVPPSSGTLYKNYSNGSGTVVSSYDYFTYNTSYGANSLNSVTFVPKAGYTGIIDIPFFISTLTGANMTGTVRIYVVAEPFSDVNPSLWAAPYINRLYASGIIGGTSANTFSPDADMKYGEALKMILLAAGYPQQSETGGAHWASGYLTLAYRNGIVSSTNIDLNAAVDRDTVAAIAAKALKLSSASSTDPGIIPPSDSKNGYVYALYNAGIVGGEYVNGVNYYYGSRNISRAEVAKIICKISDFTNNNK